MNQVAKHWKDYECIDAGSGEKLERWKDIILRRPDPQVIWPMEENSMWNSPHAHYHRSKSGGGSWEYKKKFKDSWTVSYGDLRFKVSPTGIQAYRPVPRAGCELGLDDGYDSRQRT